MTEAARELAEEEFSQKVADFIWGARIVACGEAVSKGDVMGNHQALSIAISMITDPQDNRKLIEAASVFAASEMAPLQEELQAKDAEIHRLKTKLSLWLRRF